MCGKGTVLDVLSNHKIHLDDMFKSSMINDTAKVPFIPYTDHSAKVGTFHTLH